MTSAHHFEPVLHVPGVAYGAQPFRDRTPEEQAAYEEAIARGMVKRVTRSVEEVLAPEPPSSAEEARNRARALGARNSSALRRGVGKPLSERVKRVLRLHHEGLDTAEIARRTGEGSGIVRKFVVRHGHRVAEALREGA